MRVQQENIHKSNEVGVWVVALAEAAGSFLAGIAK